MMRKAINVKISKIVVVLFLLLFSANGFSHQQEITAHDDYIILNKTIERYMMIKKFSDSLFYNSAVYTENSSDKLIIREVKLRKKRDTLTINHIADNTMYKQYLHKDAHWKRAINDKTKLSFLEHVFSKDEIANYELQSDLSYVWNKDNIHLNNRVVFNTDVQFSRAEIDDLPKSKKQVELNKIYNLEKNSNLYTFSKPIYSLDKNYAIISYQKEGTRILTIFEKLEDKWVYKNSINNNMFITRILD